MKIVVLDGYSLNPGDLDWDILNEFGEVTVYDRTTAEDVIERSKDADIILTNKVEIDRTTIQKLPKLKMIAVLATGYNIIDCKVAREAGVTVTNIPAYSTDSVAQMVFAHLLNIINRVQYYTDENRNLRWSNNLDFCYWDTTFHELTGKKIGVIGLGHIGSRVAHIADAFGMQVIAMTSKHQEELPLYINKVEKDELLRTADVITLHCPLTEDTANFICANTLSLMKPTAIVINLGRGPLADDDAIAHALREHRIAAYATDVMRQEPPASDNPLLSAPNCYITPHIAWATYEARMRLMEILKDNIHAFIYGTPINVVNK